MTKRLNNVRRMAELARSPRGASFPQPIIDKIVQLAEKHDEYDFTFGAPNVISKSTNFFKNQAENMIFIDCHGEEFSFSNEADPIKYNELFVGIYFLKEKQVARVYARF